MAAAPAIERVTGVTVFTDIVGFTEYTALQGDLAALSLLSHQERIVSEELPPGARIVKELGDGLLLWFPDACQAIACALRLQQRFEEHSRGGDADPLWVRMGAHWGTQSLRRGDLVGHDVNLASRVPSLAGAGEVLLSEATVARIGPGLPGIVFDELGPVSLKGIPHPVRIFRAIPPV